MLSLISLQNPMLTVVLRMHFHLFIQILYGTYNLLQAVLLGKAHKMIQISTDEVYGSLGPNDPPFTETTPLAPNNPYSASKASADLLVRSYYKTHQLPLILQGAAITLVRCSIQKNSFLKSLPMP